MICPKCKSSNVIINDDSFDYGAGHHGAGGIEVIKYPSCRDCGYGEQEGEDDWDES